MSRLITLRLADRCTADPHRRAGDLTLHGTRVELVGDTVVLDGRTVLRRVEPNGLGDVHWDAGARDGEPAGARRYTHVEIDT